MDLHSVCEGLPRVLPGKTTNPWAKWEFQLGKAFEGQCGHKYYTVHHTLPSFYKFHFKDVPHTGTKLRDPALLIGTQTSMEVPMTVINAKTPRNCISATQSVVICLRQDLARNIPASLQLKIIPLQPPKWQDYRHTPSS